jgi:YfiH family protein
MATGLADDRAAMIQADDLAIHAGVRHAFLTRRGGVSDGPFRSLNCGWSGGDDPARVAENRTRALARIDMPGDSLCTARQVHGSSIHLARTASPGPPTIEADALVTDRPGITLGVLSADCAPVLLADPAAGVIGAVHAGWRGALAGVIEAAVASMVALGASPARMTAAVGPCIAQASYEVGPELGAAFVAEDPASARYFAPAVGSDRLHLDLEGYALHRLARSEVVGRVGLGLDTLADPEHFFSSRRTRKAGGTRFGLLLSVIALVR